MPDLKIIWSGKIPLEDVVWKLSSEKEYFLSTELEKQRNKIWKKIVNKYPETYDGMVIILDDFHYTSEQMVFDLGFMRFSRILTLNEVKQRPSGYGSLGMQAIIFSPDKTNVLAGLRAEDSSYCPLFHAVPGGILETSDVEGSFESACMREIDEEVAVALEAEKHLVGLLSELHGSVGVVALISGTVSKTPKPNEHVYGNEEWAERRLSWYSGEELERIKFENSLEGLLFVKNDRERFEKTGNSIFWNE
jgi:hypothetical protein